MKCVNNGSLPARASEQGNVIGFVRISTKNIVIERTREPIYIFLHSVSHHDIFFYNAFYKLVRTKNVDA